MSSAAGPLIKPLSMAKGCLTSPPSLFNTKTSFSFISLPSKPIKSLHFTCSSSSSSSSSWVSVKYKNSSSSSVVAMVASTSDWAQQEDGTRGREESYSKPLEEDRLFVANLPYDVDSQKLAELFQEAGIVEIAEVIYNRQTGQSRGFGFVTMSSIEEADKAIEMFDRYSINGRLLTVSKAGEEKGFRPAQRRQNFDPALKLYVGNLPFHVDDARLQQIFSEVGKVADARIITDGETGRSRGYGFVTMSTETEVEDAVTAFNGQDLDGRTIKVNRRDLF